MPGFLAGTKHLTRIERQEMGDVRGKRLLHLSAISVWTR